MDPKRSKEITFTLTGHAHLDPVWLWQRQEGIETVKATFRSALDRIRENPDLVFVHSSAAQYEWMTLHPHMMDEIRAAVAAGQWELGGGFWVEPDMNIPSGEALARQGLYGQRFFERVLGRRSRYGFLPDSFGHPVTLPQILKQCGLEYFLFWRPFRGEVDLPSDLFWWQGPDGTRILSARIESYNSSPNVVTDTINAAIDWRPADAPEWIVVYGVGNHGGGPTVKAIRNMRELQKDPDWPTLQFGSIEGFFDRAAGREHPTFDKGLQHTFRGCYTSHSEVKRLNRYGEQALVTAEKWSAIADRFGQPYPTQRLESAWRHVLFNQFHDIICGTSIPSAYEDTQNELREAIGVGKRTGFEALQVIAARIETRSGDHQVEEAMRRVRTGPGNAVADLGDGVPVVVFNPSPWPRREVLDVEVNDWHISEMRVQDEQGNPVVHQFAEGEAGPPRKRAAFVADVPPLGYRLYRIVDKPAAEPAADAPMLAADESIMENTWWKLQLDPRTGALRSLRDKRQDRELLAGAGAQLLVMDDPYNPWGRGDFIRHLAGVFGQPEVKLVENGPVRATWAITTRWGESVATQEITIYREIPAIHGKLSIDWHGEYYAVKLAFPFALTEAEATFSVPFGHVTQHPSGEEEPTQQWLDVTGRPLGVTGRVGGNDPGHENEPGVEYEAGAGAAAGTAAASGVGAGTGGAARRRRRSDRYGVALLNDCKYGADVLGGEARLTILRSPIYGGPNRDSRPPRHADRYLDQGFQEVRWALVPHEGPWQEAGVVQQAQDWGEPLAFVREYAHPGDLPQVGSFVAIEPSGAVALTALKRAEDGEDWILRFYEPHGQAARVRVQIPLLAADFTAEAGPHQIKTFRISAGGGVREVNFLEE